MALTKRCKDENVQSSFLCPLLHLDRYTAINRYVQTEGHDS